MSAPSSSLTLVLFSNDLKIKSRFSTTNSWQPSRGVFLKHGSINSASNVDNINSKNAPKGLHKLNLLSFHPCDWCKGGCTSYPYWHKSSSYPWLFWYVGVALIRFKTLRVAKDDQALHLHLLHTRKLTCTSLWCTRMPSSPSSSSTSKTY